MVGGAEYIELQVEIDCDLDDKPLNEFLINATYASPLNGLMRGQLESLFKLGKNGRELPTAKVAELDGPLFADPGNHFAKAEPIPDARTLLEPVGPTPKKDVDKGTSASGSSLSDEQDRRLNVGAVAVLRQDGIKEIQQMPYSPYGTSFRFLSSEDGRAPDANTLISAGIGFCFMTRFGRFVSILKLDLPDYRIVQNTHFSLGGASGGTGKAGEADPVQTHVYSGNRRKRRDGAGDAGYQRTDLFPARLLPHRPEDETEGRQGLRTGRRDARGRQRRRLFRRTAGTFGDDGIVAGIAREGQATGGFDL